MEVRYRIIQLNESDHTMVIRYFSDLITEDFLANDFNEDGSIRRCHEGYPTRCRTDFCISVPIAKPNQRDLEHICNLYCPWGWFETQEKILSGELSLVQARQYVGTSDVVVRLEPPKTLTAEFPTTPA